MSRQVIIRCNHCNKQLQTHYATLNIETYGIGIKIDKRLELCDKCAQNFKELIMDYIQPKHYKY